MTAEQSHHAFQDLATLLVEQLVSEHQRIVASLQAEVLSLQQASLPRLSGPSRSAASREDSPVKSCRIGFPLPSPDDSDSPRSSLAEVQDDPSCMSQEADGRQRHTSNLHFPDRSNSASSLASRQEEPVPNRQAREVASSQLGPPSSQPEVQESESGPMTSHRPAAEAPLVTSACTITLPRSHSGDGSGAILRPSLKTRKRCTLSLGELPHHLNQVRSFEGDSHTVSGELPGALPNLLQQPLDSRQSFRRSFSKGSRSAFALMGQLENVLCGPNPEDHRVSDDSATRFQRRHSSSGILQPLDVASSGSDSSPNRFHRRQSFSGIGQPLHSESHSVRRGSYIARSSGSLGEVEAAQETTEDREEDVEMSGRERSKCPTNECTPFNPWPLWEFVINEWENSSRTGCATEDVEPRRLSRSQTSRILASCDKAAQESHGLVWKMMQRLVINPDSLKRVYWLCSTMGMVTYDMLITPLMVGFDVYENPQIKSMAVVIAGYWTIDMVLSFFIGYHDKTCKLEMNPAKTAMRYAKNWMLFDIFMLVADWTFIILIESLSQRARHAGGVLKMMRLLRMLRFTTLLRLLRIPKTTRAMRRVFGHSEYASLTMGILGHLFGILLMNHIIACAWCLLGISFSPGWVETYEQNSPMFGRYMTALHWSLTQFTPATMSVQPQNIWERIFAVAVLLFALVSFSSFVSSITNLMTHLRNLRSSELKQFAELDGYLKQNNISLDLGIRIRRFLEHISQQKGGIKESDVHLLAKLSKPLQMELRFEVHRPLLSRHLFFLCFSNASQAVMQRLCTEALNVVQLSAGDALFTTADAATCMHFVSTGVLIYTLQNTKLPESVSGTWFCESVLWTPWEHRGNMRALTESSLLQMDAEKLRRILNKNRSALHFPAAYACEVVAKLCSVGTADLTDLDYKILDSERMLRLTIDSDAVPHQAQKESMLGLLAMVRREKRPSGLGNDFRGFLPLLAGLRRGYNRKLGSECSSSVQESSDSSNDSESDQVEPQSPQSLERLSRPEVLPPRRPSSGSSVAEPTPRRSQGSDVQSLDKPRRSTSTPSTGRQSGSVACRGSRRSSEMLQEVSVESLEAE
eukprot:TRINITY_DN33732_c0_g1_i1.p1 TRINITY_DN33732_c0_g1~~TRINITY_DN33732_c0_g1_i1.p1  ORF type:complete len:1109 (-),score=157.04 TRINITY_DN33732_c0_g1_i1:84-3353(-)